MKYTVDTETKEIRIHQDFSLREFNNQFNEAKYEDYTFVMQECDTELDEGFVIPPIPGFHIEPLPTGIG